MIFTEEEQSTLRKNPHVRSCTGKYITFTDAFKELAVRRHKDEGIPARVIFTDAGFALSLIGKDSPDSTLARWRRQATSGIAPQKKGRKKRSFDPALMTDKERIAYLEAEVDYLKSLHAFFQSRQARK